MDNSDAEDTIKLLLEHIDTKPEETAKSNQECEYCKEILMAFNETQDEKDNMKKVLAELELENGTLITNNRSALKRADELEVKLKGNEQYFMIKFLNIILVELNAGCKPLFYLFTPNVQVRLKSDAI